MGTQTSGQDATTLDEAMTAPTVHRRAQRPDRRVPVVVVGPMVALALMTLVGCGGNDEEGRGGPGVPAAPLEVVGLEIVYASANGEDEFHLWLMRADGTDPVQLTDGDGVEATAAWSPDGTLVAFAASDDPEGEFDLWLVGADGTGLRQLTDTDDRSEASPSWSPDADRLVYSENTLDDEGAAIRILEIDAPDGGAVTVVDRGDWPSWAPDGRSILYTGDAGGGVGQLFTVSVDGGEPTMLELDGSATDLPASAYEAAWSPDGTRIAFVASSGDGGSEDPVEWNEDIWVADADGTGARKVVSSPGNDHWMPTWSADGQHLMYSADGTENEGEIARVDVDTGEVTVLTENDRHDMMPSWRPEK